MARMNITAGLDIGNGYVKAAMRGADKNVEKFDIAAGVATVTSAVDLPTPDSAAVSTVREGFYNDLDVSFATPLVGSNYRRLFGERGLSANASLYEEFDVVSETSKAEQELSPVFILGLFAAKAVKDSVTEHGSLPDSQIEVTARVGLALPIDEYRNHRKGYAAKLKDSTHLVTVHNFETPVSVKISFADVQVAAEGSSAQFAIMESGVSLTKAMLKDVASRGFDVSGLDPEEVHGAENVVGIDIGEGTVNFPVYSNTQFNPDASRTFDEGYGTVLLNALPDLRNAGVPFKSRKKLVEFLLKEPSTMKSAQHAKATGVVAAHAELWCQALIREFDKVFADVRYDAEVAYVYGGGSGPLRDVLHPMLQDHVGDAFPVLYLDPAYSRHLNREGLLIAVTRMEQAAKKKG